MADESGRDYCDPDDAAAAVSDLFDACSNGVDEIVRLLLIAYDIDLEKKTRNRTPLLEACWHGHRSTAEILSTLLLANCRYCCSRVVGAVIVTTSSW